MIIEQLEVSPFMENAFILGCEETKEAAIIDPGDEADRILSVVKALGLKTSVIINTHAHIDHIGAVQEIKEETGVKFLLHKAELPFVEAYDQQCRMFGVSFGKQPSVDGFLDEGQIVKVGNLDVKVVLTPGHSAGGLCFIVGDAVFSGDTLFAGSIGRTDLPGGNYDTLIRMIKTKLLVLPPETRVFSGHGPATTIGREARSNPFLLA